MEKQSKIKIIVWATGFWCMPDEFEEMELAGASDDYEIIEVDENYGPDEIDEFIAERGKEDKNGGS